MIRPGTFERVYAALRQQLRGGAFRPGDRLEPAALSDRLNASVTPVRDALHRLTGERLVEAPRHDGFRVPLLTETMVRQLYSWHLEILLLAIASSRAERPPRPDQQSAGEADCPLEAALLDLVASSGNPEHLAALRNVRDRLASYGGAESEFLDAVEEEAEEIIGAIGARDRPALRRALGRYHRRRLRIVPELLARVQGGSEGTS